MLPASSGIRQGRTRSSLRVSESPSGLGQRLAAARTTVDGKVDRARFAGERERTPVTLPPQSQATANDIGDPE